MIEAEALASMLIAWTLPRILARSRSTTERLFSASDRLPPDCCWMLITMAKKFTSAVGTRSNRRETASPSDRPIAWVSTTVRNSLRTGSSASRETMRKQSPTGMPVRMPRTTTSTALGSSLLNFAMRRSRRWRSSQRRQAEAAREGRPETRDRAVGDQEEQQPEDARR